MTTRDHRCPQCERPTTCRAFSGGAEWCCPESLGGCGADGYYPADVLPCFRCGRELEQINRGTGDRQPAGGTVFRSHGNYGSTVYDPPMYTRNGLHDEYLEINICDVCMTTHTQRVLHVRITPGPSVETTRPWVGMDRQEENDENGEE